MKVNGAIDIPSAFKENNMRKLSNCIDCKFRKGNKCNHPKRIEGTGMIYDFDYTKQNAIIGYDFNKAKPVGGIIPYIAHKGRRYDCPKGKRK